MCVSAHLLQMHLERSAVVGAIGSGARTQLRERACGGGGWDEMGGTRDFHVLELDER